MLFKRAHATVFIRHRFTNFFRSLGFIILAISSAMYFISYIQPTVIFFQHEVGLGEKYFPIVYRLTTEMLL